MKPKNIRWLFFGITFFLLVSTLAISLLINWAKLKWIFFGTLIASAIGWLIYMVVYLIQLFGKSNPTEKVDPEDAIMKEIEKIKHDKNNPDNFVLKEYDTIRVGSKGQENPVVIMYGYGTETKTNRVSIINLNNLKETTRRINLTEEQINKLKEFVAEHPDKQGVELIERADPFGRTFEKIQRTLPSSQKERDENEKKELEEKSTV